MRARNQIIIAGLAACLFLASTAQAEVVPTPSDEATIDKIMDATTAQLKAGKSRAAVDAFFNGNALMASKASDLAMLSAQIDAAAVVVGPISNCNLVEQHNRGVLVIQRLYHCQHTNSVTRWLVAFVKTTKGWQGQSIFFDDKVTDGLSE